MRNARAPARSPTEPSVTPPSLVITTPILAFMVSEFLPGQPLQRMLPHGWLNWILLMPATLVVLWAGSSMSIHGHIAIFLGAFFTAALSLPWSSGDEPAAREVLEIDQPRIE